MVYYCSNNYSSSKIGEKNLMLDAIKSYEDVDSWKTVMFLYNSALKEVGTKLEILNDEFQHVHQYNPTST